MGVRKIDVSMCTGCAICVDYCPMDVLKMDGERQKAFIKYLRDCQSCFLCERVCPENAITCIPVYERRIPLPW
ncbi:MAG: ferredoxin family protein [Dehalococcoidia bacterium]|nr:ferredoxin family protein [Dehalococcoidia bacterium]